MAEAPGRPILFELARLAAVVALPLLGVIAFMLFDAARRDMAHATDDTRSVADETAARSERFLGDFRATLETIAQRPLVRAMDPAHCDPELSTLRDLYPRAGNIIVVDAEGWIICGAKPPPSGERLRVADMELQRAVVRDGMFRISQPLIGRIGGTWGVTAVQPVRGDDGSVIGAVGMQVNLSQLQPFGRVERESTIAGIVARPGIVIAQSVAPEEWIGKDVSSTPAIAAMLMRSEGTLRDVAFDGKDLLWAFRQVAGTNWVSYAGVDAASAIAPTRRRGVAALLLIAVIVGATVGAAAYAARRIARPIRAIAEVARARASGSLDSRASIEGPREVADVAVAFNAAQGRLQLQLSRLNLLHRITRAIGERHDLRSIFQVVIRSLEVDLPIDFGCICLYDETARMLIVSISGKPLAEQERVAVDSNGLSTCMRGQLIY